MWLFDLIYFIFKRNENNEENYKKFLKSLSKLGGNTEYEIECPDCGYSETYIIGGGHGFTTRDSYNSYDLSYCPICREPLHSSWHSEHHKIVKERNKYCPNCGTKTIEFKMDRKIKLVCPQCKKDNIKVTDLESFWMT